MSASVVDLISVVIVTHQSATTVEQCVARLLASSCAVDVVVVDNASDDGTLASLQREADTVARVLRETGARDPGGSSLRVLANTRNLGFAQACNQGAAMATGEIFLFLNPDAFVETDTIARLAAHLRATPRLGLLGCRILDELGQPHGPQRRREPTWWRSLMSFSGLSRLERHWPALSGVEVAIDPGPRGRTPRSLAYVDAVNGAVMMLPRDIFFRLHGFDEGFTLHAEDLDLCRRVRDGGWDVAMAGDVEVVHIGGVSSRRRPIWVEWQKTRSLWRYFRKHQAGAGRLVGPLVALGLGARFVMKSLVITLSRRRVQ